jgi:hypothetical protein
MTVEFELGPMGLWDVVAFLLQKDRRFLQLLWSIIGDTYCITHVGIRSTYQTLQQLLFFAMVDNWPMIK